MKKEASLSIIEDTLNHKFLMIKHHRGINQGYVNFPGGKKDPGETMTDCVIRETFEETGLIIKNPVQVGYVEFPGADFYVYVFKSTEFSGTLKQKEDEVNAFWVDVDKIPYAQMRESDQTFLPDILTGKFVKRRLLYDEKGCIKAVIDL